MPEQNVMKRLSMLGKKIEIKCKGEKFIEEKYNPSSNIEIKTKCRKLESGRFYREITYYFKNFEKSIVFTLHDDLTVRNTSQIDNRRTQESVDRKGWDDRKLVFYGVDFIFDEESKKVKELSCRASITKDVPGLHCRQMYFNPDMSRKCINAIDCKKEEEDYFETLNRGGWCDPTDCAEIIPFITIGNYKIIFDNIEVKEKPANTAKTLFNLDEDEKIEVMEDTQIFSEINYDIAPWVKIRTRKGKEGYVFGAGIAEIR